MGERVPSDEPRSEEARLYDTADWPGTSSFYPRHLEEFAQRLRDAVENSEESEDPEVSNDTSEDNFVE